VTTPEPQRRAPTPLPGGLREELTRGLPIDLDEDLRWWIERFCEDVYARGYSVGYLDGWPSGAAHEERRTLRAQQGRSALDDPLGGAPARRPVIDMPTPEPEQ